MNKLATRLTALLLAAVPAWGSSVMAADSTDEPIITFKTNIYNEYGDANSFHIVLGSTEKDYFDIDYGFGPEEVVVEPAYFNTETQSITGTVVQLRVNPEGVVKIYGDPSKIDYFDAEGCYIESIDLSRCVNLEILDLQHNEIKALDLTPQTRLAALYLTDNPFTEATPLVVGAPKPSLQILEIDIIDHLSDSFNLSDYPELVTFDGYHNLGLKTIDPTGCPKLQVLSVELTDVSSIDVSKNPLLMRLNVSDTRVTELNLSNNPKLQHLLAQHVSSTFNTDVKIPHVDLSHNPELILLNLEGNGMTAVDLSANTLLTNLSLRNNDLTAIDLSANTMLYSVDLTDNDLDFATLPLPKDTWGEYFYSQKPLACGRSCAVDSPLDFSGRVLRQGTQTSVRVWKQPLAEGASVIDPENYTYDNGKITFHNALTDSVYVEFINSAFEEYTLRSSTFKVKSAAEFGQPSTILSLSTAATMAGKSATLSLALDGATTAAPRRVLISVAGGEAVTYDITGAGTSAADVTPVTFTLPSSGSAPVTVSLPEGEVLTALSIDGVALSSIDLSAATELRFLNLTNCNLRSIDLANNRCLQSLDLSGNRLASLDLTGVYGNYEKHVLTSLKAASNLLSNVEIISTTQLLSLDLSGNRLTTFNLKNFDNLRNLDLSSNAMTGELSLTYLSNAEAINLSHNKLDSVTVVDMPALRSFDISDNKFTIKTLPVLPSLADGVFTYAPQQKLEIMKRAPGINISAQYRVINGQGTRFVWTTTDGTSLIEGVDMVCDNGATRFLRDDIGTVFCTMTHPAFPRLSGADSFTTTPVEVTGAPTTLVASFTTTEATDRAEVIFTGHTTTALYIDWRGDGTEYLQYPMVADTYTSYPGQQTYAGAEAKVYTYDSPDDVAVFSIYDAKMEKLDASPMKKLRAFSIGGAGLDEQSLIFPAADNITELNLQGNNFSTATFKEFPLLTSLVLSANAYESFSVADLPRLETLMMGNNRLTSFSFGDNSKIWGLDLSTNSLESFSAAGAPLLQQLILNNNSLTSVDLEANSANLIVLDLSGNKFDFATLPRHSSFPRLNVYAFASQAPIEISINDGQVDLTSQAKVGDTETIYRWFLGDVTFDPDTASLVGEELIGNTGDDPEYWVKDGVTSFCYTFNDPVTGVLYNTEYDGLYLFTTPVRVTAEGIESISADGSRLDPDAIVDVHTLTGIAVRRSVRFADSLIGLPAGIYIVGGHKYMHR